MIFRLDIKRAIHIFNLKAQGLFTPIWREKTIRESCNML